MKKVTFLLKTLLFVSAMGQPLVFSSLSAASQHQEVDVTTQFDQIIQHTTKRFRELSKKWPFTKAMFEKDILYLTKQNKIERALTLYYKDLDTWRQAETWIRYLIGYFQTGAPGDLKSTVFAQYNRRNQKVLYKGKKYTVEALGNINYGVALKAAGFPLFVTQCAAGFYQLKVSLVAPKATSDQKSFIKAVAKNGDAFKGVCFDHFNDSKMVKTGYNW